MVSERLQAKILQSWNSSLSEIIRYGGYAFDLYLDSVGSPKLTREERAMREDALESLHLPQRFDVAVYLLEDLVKDSGARTKGIDNKVIAHYFWRNFIDFGNPNPQRVYIPVKNHDGLYDLSVKSAKLLAAICDYALNAGKMFVRRAREGYMSKQQPNPLRKQLKVIQGGKK